MTTPEKDSKINLRAVTIGFILIIAVTSVFFLKNSFESKKEKELAENILKEQEKQIKNYKSISAQDLSEKMDSDEDILIIDIRSQENFQHAHILDSINIPFSELESALRSLKKESAYVIVDNLGLTPEKIQAMRIFSENGFEKTAYLEGGIFEWKNQMRPIINAGDPYSFTDQSKVTYINSDKLNELISQEEDLYILDLRKRKDFEEGHLKNATNISLDELESRRKEIPMGKKIILYDNDGILAFQGAVRLFDMGIFNIYTLSDGLNAWKEKGF